MDCLEGRHSLPSVSPPNVPWFCPACVSACTLCLYPSPLGTTAFPSVFVFCNQVETEWHALFSLWTL